MKQIFVICVFLFPVLFSNANAESGSYYSASESYYNGDAIQDAGLWDYFKPKKKEACRGNEAGAADQCSKYNMKIETSGRCYGDDPEDTGIPAPCCCFG